MRNTKPLLLTGMLAILAAILLHFAAWGSAGWLFIAGALMMLLYRTFEMQKVDGVTERRLFKIHFISGVILLAAGYFMTIGKEYWKILILISAVLDLYVSFRVGNNE